MSKIHTNERLTVMEVYQYLCQRAHELRDNGEDDRAVEHYYIAGLLERTKEINP